MTIRARLTAWTTLVLAIVLAAAGATSYGVMKRELRRTTDATLAANARQVQASLRDEATENHGLLLPGPAAEVLNTLRDNERPLLLFTRQGTLYASSAGRAAFLPSLSAAAAAPPPSGYVTLGEVRFLLTPSHLGTADFVIATGQSLQGQATMLAGLRRAMLLTIPLALLIAAGGGYLLARKGLGPVAAMSAKARAISAASLGERIVVANRHDELGQLAATLNELLARLEESFASQRRFMAEASHELRTPVTILQGELDVALSRDDRDALDYRQSLAIMRKSVRRLARIVQDLFLLARGDAGQYPFAVERFYLDDVVAQTVQSFRTVAAERGVALSEEHDDDLAVRGDEDLLQRMVGNLVENAIRHAPAGGKVTVRCTEEKGARRIEVGDSGPGIAPELREQIFERFFRVGEGAGLGLPIARWIAEAHGGRLWLERSDERGSVFVALLPAE